MQSLRDCYAVWLEYTLLTGRPVDEKQLEESNLGKNSYGSVVMALEGPAITSIQSGKIIAAMKGKCGCDTYITGITYRPQILMVCVLYGDVEPEHLKDLAGELLKEITGHEYGIHCGNVVEHITDIRNSYLKTLTNTGENDGNTPELNSAVAEAIQKFGESMYSGDADKIQKLLDVVESRLATIEDFDALKNYYCYKLMTVYFANAKDSQNLKEEMARLIAFSDTRQLFVMLRQSVRRLCTMLNENEQTTANKLSKKLLNYVDVNFVIDAKMDTTEGDSAVLQRLEELEGIYNVDISSNIIPEIFSIEMWNVCKDTTTFDRYLFSHYKVYYTADMMLEYFADERIWGFALPTYTDGDIRSQLQRISKTKKIFFFTPQSEDDIETAKKSYADGVYLDDITLIEKEKAK